MDIGRLNKRITFYKLTGQTKDAYNRITQKPVAYITVWASVEPQTGKEYLEADRNKDELTLNIYIRYRSDITSDMVIGYKGKKIEIIGPPINIMESNEMLKIICKYKEGETIE